MKELIDRLEQERILTPAGFETLLACEDDTLRRRAQAAREQIFGNGITLRGLVEFTNYCKNNCYYCGLRRGNPDVQRYRLTKEQILACCANGYAQGLRTFVLQGGEDPYYTDGMLAEIVRGIKAQYADCAVTLSLGERSHESLKLLREAGADRYLLRQETSDSRHYAMLHPPGMSLSARQKCLWDLKELGYQVGCGFMVGSPGQTPGRIVEDLLFIKGFNPEMVGIGPFIPHASTPFAGEKPGELRLVLNAIAILRLMKPNLLLPATTALGTIHETGYELGILAGANVVMPNITPANVRENYLLYGNKSRMEVSAVHRRLRAIGCEAEISKGDYFDV